MRFYSSQASSPGELELYSAASQGSEGGAYMQQMSHPQYAINMGGTLIHAGFQNGFH
jgi:hypothetical protein